MLLEVKDSPQMMFTDSKTFTIRVVRVSSETVYHVLQAIYHTSCEGVVKNGIICTITFCTPSHNMGMAGFVGLLRVFSFIFSFFKIRETNLPTNGGSPND